AFVLAGRLSRGDAVAGIAVFGLAGLGCSALVPLTISFGEQELTTMSAAVAGGIVAFYQIGFGIAAFGVGPLERAGISLAAIFRGAAIVAAVLAGLAFLVVKGLPAAQLPGSGHKAARSQYPLPDPPCHCPALRMCVSSSAACCSRRLVTALAMMSAAASGERALPAAARALASA